MGMLERLKEEFRYMDTCCTLSEEGDALTFEIINPFWDENIEVMLERDEITFFFAYQHAHFEDIGDAIDYVWEYVAGNLVSIEFFGNGKDLFGGGKVFDDIDTTSGESLLRSFTGDDRELYKCLVKNYLKGKNCCCKIRGWNSVQNRDIEFVL